MAAIPNAWQGTPLTFHPNGKSVGMWMTPRDTDEGVCMEAHSYKPLFASCRPFDGCPQSFTDVYNVVGSYSGVSFKRGTYSVNERNCPGNTFVDTSDATCPNCYMTSTYGKTVPKFDKSFAWNFGSSSKIHYFNCGTTWDNKGELVYKDRILPYTTKHGFAQGNLVPTFMHRQAGWADGWENIPTWGGTSCSAEVTFGNLTWRAHTSEHLTVGANSFLYYGDVCWIDPTIHCYASPALWLPDNDEVDTVRYTVCPMVYKHGYLIINDNDYVIDGALYWCEAVNA